MKKQSFLLLLKRWRFWLTLTFALPALMFALLYVSGLGGEMIQQRVQFNAARSLPQFESEETYPRMLDQEDQSCIGDNFTETLLVQMCLHMDTLSRPSSVITNSYFSGKYGPDERNVRILSLIDDVNGAIPNQDYDRYYAGARMYLRPLLAFFTYPQIRSILAAFFFLLAAAALVTVYREGGAWLAGSLAVALVMMNLPVVSTSIQFTAVFFVLFTAIIAMPFVRKKAKKDSWIAPFFYTVGACTMFFDMYTAPIITLTVPLIVLLSLPDASKRWSVVFAAVLSWFAGYGMMWIIKLAAASIVRGGDAFIAPFQAFTKWTGITEDDCYAQFTAGRTAELVFRVLFPKRQAPVLAFSALAFFVGLIHARLRRFHLRRPDFRLLAVAVLPVLWMLAAKKATGNHFWFQYRLMLGTIFGLFAFCVGILPAAKPASVAIAKE